MGFPASLVNLIERCITSVSYKILLNGQPSPNFLPERGLRQGDLLTPYLFILCVDVLLGLLKKEVNTKKIHGTQVARKTPVIPHLFFADDCLLFARSNQGEADRIMAMLMVYEEASGQVIKLDKMEVSFSRNLMVEENLSICSRLRVISVLSHTKYLGMLVIFG